MLPILLTGLTLTLAAPAAKDAPKKEPATLVGEWTMEAGVKAGVAEPRPANPVRFNFSAEGKVTMTMEGKPPVPYGDFKLDATKKPCEITINLPPVGGKEFTLQGIWKIEGETATVCLAPVARPDKFESSEESPTILFTLKRIKAAR